jgi:competence ComEA-like helix-hairpin-helix protein
MKLGLPERLVKTILNYRSKGGQFYQKEDLQKIYGLRAEQYRILEPYINIAPKAKVLFLNKTATIKAPIHVVNLNTADSAELDGLKGIGPAFALRIIHYRDLLGGFVRPEQLLEVYNLDTTMYKVLRPAIKVDPSQIKKININVCPFPAMKRHPYIGYYMAKAIADYRVKFGKFRTIEELHLIKGITPEQIEKIKPYVIVIE